ncbi:uncharacterized protein LOC123367299 [Mauremys mutica]|uniref:uncharacterized protein LOC123367299 n=1 Tax=Mauremys mutica TaxID=74926 RepID=UPI001D16F13E|nr:uncharacterized protein LOC123367299 [Mauremys mutica]
MGDLRNIVVITHSFHLLTYPDAMLRNIAASAMQDVIRKRKARTPSNQYVATYLRESLKREFGRDGGDLASLWTHARSATQWLEKHIGCHCTRCKECQELGVLVPQVKDTEHTSLTPKARTMLERSLKDAICCQYAENLKQKPDQGKAFQVTCKWDVSNHFLSKGSFTRFADWRFIHRAQLNCIPLKGAVLHGNRDKLCRKCEYANETLPHILCSCKPHSSAWKPRNNAIQGHLVKAILRPVAMNSAIPGMGSQLRLDIIITNEEWKKIIMVDVIVPVENRTPAFRNAQSRKLTDNLRARHYVVQTHADRRSAWDPTRSVAGMRNQ